MSFCFLYNVVLENHSVQNFHWGGGGGGGGERGLLPAQGLRWQVGCYMATKFCYMYVSIATNFYTR